MSRPKKRKVKVTFESRNAEDPKRTLDAVEHAFRPGEIEIVVRDPKQEQESLSIPDEQLEQRTKDAAAQLLDSKDLQLQPGASGLLDARPAESAPSGVAQKIIVTRLSLRARITDLVKGGYQTTVYQVAKALFDSLKQ